MESHGIVRPVELACLKEGMCPFMHSGLHENHKEEVFKMLHGSRRGEGHRLPRLPLLVPEPFPHSHRLLSLSVMIAVSIISAL